MNTASHNKLVSFIWNIADDCLRDVYVRGKYRDVILPMVVLRRLDTLLEPSKEKVLSEVEFQKNEMELTELDAIGLQEASGYVFYNISKWTLKKLHDTTTNSQQILQANFEDYLNGFSPNVKEIIDKFKLRSQIKHMADKDVLLDVLQKFVSPYINLTPFEKDDPEGIKLPPLTNLGMGYVFEELIRMFNEENNEEAGEHFTPREVIDLMTHLIFDPIKNSLPPVMTIYDPACGSGGMLTESQNFIKDETGQIKATGDVYLYGKEINDETYAICKSDMMIKGNDPENIKNGSTLSTNEFAGTYFDFMLSNPPYGKSWASEQKYIKDGKDIIDSRFTVVLDDYWGHTIEEDAAPRSSDGQLLFLMEMISKIKSLDKSPSGSRIAFVHNGSSLFTGDAGGGESNIRRYIIENVNLNTKKRKTLLKTDTWIKQRKLLQAAEKLEDAIGNEEFNDFNLFKAKVDTKLKENKIKLTSSEKSAIFGAISWYDADAEKVIKKKEKLTGDKLSNLLEHLGCDKAELSDFGYFPTDKENEYILYETENDLRDSENIPLKEEIQAYFLREVKPHVSEAWINLDITKIGYEISFNKYFYRHKPLRSIEEVSADMLALEKESEGLIMEILGMAE